MIQVAPLLVLGFLAITFLQSGYDKIKDWKGNTEWLTGHFANTILAKQVPFALGIILLLEIVSGVLCVSGIIQHLMQDVVLRGLGFYGAILSSITLLFTVILPCVMNSSIFLLANSVLFERYLFRRE